MGNQINIDSVASQISKKANRNLDNTENVDYVIEWQGPTGSDNQWYRLYKSGWIEQGGMTGSPMTSISKVITFPKKMSGNYTWQVTGSWTPGSSGYNEGANNMGATGMTLTCSDYNGLYMSWYVCGFADLT